MQDLVNLVRRLIGVEAPQAPAPRPPIRPPPDPSPSWKRPRPLDDDQPPHVKRYRTVRSYFPKIMPKQDECDDVDDFRRSTLVHPAASTSANGAFFKRSDALRTLRSTDRRPPLIRAPPEAPPVDRRRVIELDDDDDDDDDPDDDCKYVKMIQPKERRESATNVWRKAKEIVVEDDDDDVVDVPDSDYDVMFVKRVASTPARPVIRKVSDGVRDYFYEEPKAYKFFKSRNTTAERSTQYTQNFVPDKIRKPQKITRPSIFRRSDSQRIIGASFRLDEKNSYRNLIAKYKLAINTQPKSFYAKQLKDVSVSDFFTKPAALKIPVSGYIDLTDQVSGKLKRPQVNIIDDDDDVKIDVDEFNRTKLDEIERDIMRNDIRSKPVVSTPKINIENRLKLSMRHKPVINESWLDNINKKYSEISLRKESEVEKIEEGIYIVDELIELTADQENKIEAALIPQPQGEVLIEKFNLRIHRRDIHTLSDLNWLNDEVINFYMNLIIERSEQNDKLPKTYCMNTFFLPRLMQTGHDGLKRWTRKIDIFAHDIVLVPVHLGIHWCMSVIDFKNQSIRYYDSMGGKNMECCQALLKYLEDEKLDKKKEKFDRSKWSMQCVKDIPQQMNGSDCGMFSCMFGEYISRDSPITFSQSDMPYFRRKMVLEIIEGRLLV